MYTFSLVRCVTENIWGIENRTLSFSFKRIGYTTFHLNAGSIQDSGREFDI